MKLSEMTMRDAHGKVLVELGEENRDIVVLDADLAKTTKSGDFGKAFPERFFDMGIAEQNLDKQEQVLRIYPLDWFYH